MSKLTEEFFVVAQEQAAKVRVQEKRIHELRTRVERIAELDASKIMTAIREELRQAQEG